MPTDPRSDAPRTRADKLFLEGDDTLPVGMDETCVAYWRHGAFLDRWMIWLPGVGLGDLSKHSVTEHADGTITVTPSILVTSGSGQRHGYLERGEWRDV